MSVEAPRANPIKNGRGSEQRFAHPGIRTKTNDDLEKRLVGGPVISVPSITLEGDANGAPHPEPASYATMFSGKYEHRLIKAGIGHNLPQEAPQAFAQAVIDISAES